MKFSTIITLAAPVFGFSWIGIVNKGTNEVICDSSSLSGVQKRICRRNSEFEPALVSAAKASVTSCQSVMDSKSAWKCAGVERLPFVSSQLKHATAESAYLHGLTSGQLMTSLFKLCHSGILAKECKIEEVTRFVTEFTNSNSLSRRRSPKSIGQVDAHNTKVGRIIAHASQRSVCKCHGASGSCSTKTCWQTAPLVEAVGQMAKQKYEKSIGIKIQHKDTPIPRVITNQLAKEDFLYIQN